MEDSKDIHEEILSWVGKEFRDILSGSEQAIYVYLCDKHRLCNELFLSLIGYSSFDEWANKEEMLSDVKEEDQEKLVDAYKNAMERQIGSSIDISWKNKETGEFIKTKVILVPLSYKGELFALHFISRL